MAAKSSTKPFSGNLPRDAAQVPLQIAGSKFVTSDATGSPQVSPLTVSSSIINLVVPDNAVQLILNNNANALRISELSAMTNYFLLPASITGFTIDCAAMTNIYLVRDSADVTVQFMFVTI